MILWSIQHKNAYDQMLLDGRLVVSEEYVRRSMPEFIFAYSWMTDQMIKRIGQKPKGVNYPMWAWYQWEGERKRLDMRSHRVWGEKGTPIVLLTIDVPPERVLLSDFDMWHMVLNNGYLALTEEDEKEIYSDEEKIKSWENIFNYEVETDYWNAPKSTQATMWEIKKEWILKAEHFISR